MKQLLNRAMTLLARRDHSEMELRRKLAAQFSFNQLQNKSRSLDSHVLNNGLNKEERDEQIESVIQYCYEYHWLDDKKFADSFIRSRSLKGYGPQRIKSELQHKGVNKEIISTSLADCDIDWAESAQKIIIKHFGEQIVYDWKNKSKIYNYMTNKGFDLDNIREALKNLSI